MICLSKWFISHVDGFKFLSCRAPVFSEDILGETAEGEVVPPPERSFWAKYVSTKELVVFLTLSPQFLLLVLSPP